MKTPMQEAIDKVQSLREIDAVINPIGVIEIILTKMLEKEKEVMCGIYDDAIAQFDPTYSGQEKYGEQYYNETFNTKEK